MKYFFLVPFMILLLFLLACGPEKEFVTESGVRVQYLDHGDGEGPKKDSILILYMRHRNIKDIVFHKSGPLKPLAIRYEPEKLAGHLQEVISNLVVGDSVYFETTAQNLYEETYKRAIPKVFVPHSTMKIEIRFADQLSDTAYADFDRKLTKRLDSIRNMHERLLIEQILQEDGDSIDTYLEGIGQSVTTTPSGLRYAVKQKGSGPPVTGGDEVRVHYTVRLLGGELIDDSRLRNELFGVTVGIGEVIPAWDEGLMYLGEGDRAVFYVPSPLAYGSKSPNPDIPANAIMVFDLEVVEVVKKSQ